MKKRAYLQLITIASLLVVFFVAAAVLFVGYRFQINPDGVSYISIAQGYLHGDFKHAVNGYWGPLLSWLLVPLLAVKIEPVLATKLLAVLMAGANVVLFYLVA